MLPTPQINFQRTPVTLIIAAVAVALEIVCTLEPERRVYYYNEWLGLLPTIWLGEPWRPFTSSLLHADLLHAAFNLYWLIIFGPAIENRIGSYRILLLIVLLGFVPMLAEYVIGSYDRAEPVMVVGLSGMIYGLFGVLFVGRRSNPEFEQVCNRDTTFVLIGWFLLCIFMTNTGLMNVANIAHGAGFFFGILYGQSIFAIRRRWLWATFATLATLVVLASLVYCPGHTGYEHAQLLKAYRLMQFEAQN